MERRRVRLAPKNWGPHEERLTILYEQTKKARLLQKVVEDARLLKQSIEERKVPHVCESEKMQNLWQL